MIGPDIHRRIRDLDEDAYLTFDTDMRFRLIIVGGGALLLLNAIARATVDIDVLQADRQLLHLMEAYDMNAQVNAYENNFPYNYEDRLVLIWSGRRIDFYTASLEDIVISKLCAGRPQDLEDLKGAAKHIDWEKLEYLAKADDEIKASALNDHGYSRFLQNYEEYMEGYRPCRDSP